MRRVSYSWLALLALSCATAENSDQSRLGGGFDGGGDTTMSGGVGATGTGGTNPSAGDFAMAGGGTSNSFGGSGTSGGGGFATGGGGTFGQLGGTFGQLGGMGGVAAGSAGKGGGGAGGSAAGAGGKNTGGSGGKTGTGGTAGSGGTAGVAKCGDHAIPARAQWVGSALPECAPTCSDPNGPYTAALAIDGNVATRFASGQAQAGGEWLQIDLGATATVNSVSINTVPAADYARHYQIRVSSTSVDKAAPVLAEGDGMAGNMVIPLSKAVNGQYVLITQTGMVAAGQTSWWSVNEVGVTCQ